MASVPAWHVETLDYIFGTTQSPSITTVLLACYWNAARYVKLWPSIMEVFPSTLSTILETPNIKMLIDANHIRRTTNILLIEAQRGKTKNIEENQYLKI